ncbi:MAG: MaoC family dehydratase N-terminal domain-containing protein [Proteobacteria bacterium]|nr:MaoC family dehydratase N-terminal domain-containing protein [Pseudomonadota bacterium]
MGITAEELKSRYGGMVFDSVQVEATLESMLEFARACGETDPRYTDAGHPDLQAPVNFAAKYHGARMLPDDFPEFDRRMMIDAGKAVEWIAPIRPGDELTANSHLHDIYEKTGRSGSMLFLVHRMEFSNARGELTSRVDWRLIIRGGLA